jgi:hypothetical protein
MTPKERADAVFQEYFQLWKGQVCLPQYPGLPARIEEAIQQAVDEEREQCALIADSFKTPPPIERPVEDAAQIAMLIRNRKGKPPCSE